PNYALSALTLHDALPIWVAYHEAGHALAARLLETTDPVHKISIIPRGRALGYVLQLPTEDRFLITRQEILDRVVMALAGRAAERSEEHTSELQSRENLVC